MAFQWAQLQSVKSDTFLIFRIVKKKKGSLWVFEEHCLTACGTHLKHAIMAALKATLV